MKQKKDQNNNPRLRSRLPFSFCLGILSATLTAIPANAADKIIVSFPPFDLDLPVESLEQFVNEGTFSPQVAFYANQLEEKEKENLRQILQQRLEVSASTVKAFTDLPVGKQVMKRLGEVIKTENNENGEEALIAAFNLAAASEEGLTAINLLEQFPGDIRIDLELSVKLIGELLKLWVRHNLIFDEIQKEAAASVATETKFNVNNLPDLRRPGTFRWQKESFTFKNPKRDRDSAVDLYLPLSDGRDLIPVVVISHGLASDRTTFAYLAEHLASHGLAVVVPEHIESNAERVQQIFAGFGRPIDPNLFVNRPLDIKYLLDELDGKNQSDPLLGGRLNLQQVGAIGQSFGGYTVLAVAGAELAGKEKLEEKCNSKKPEPSIIFNVSLLLQCQALDADFPTNNLRDERVKAAIAINPISSGVFGAEGMSKIQVPTFLVAGTEDIFAPALPEQIESFIGLTTPDKYLVLSKPGTHFSFIGGDESEGVFSVPPELIGPAPTLAHPYLQALTTAFFNAYIGNESEFLAYLSQSYLQSLEESPFVMNMLRSLTSEQIDKAISDSIANQEALLDQ